MRFGDRCPDLHEFFSRAIQATISDHVANRHYSAMPGSRGECWECRLLRLAGRSLADAEVVYESDKGSEGIIYEFKDAWVSDGPGQSLSLIPMRDYPGRMAVVYCDAETGKAFSVEIAP